MLISKIAPKKLFAKYFCKVSGIEEDKLHFSTLVFLSGFEISVRFWVAWNPYSNFVKKMFLGYSSAF